MKPENFAERRKLLLRFGALYITSLVLLAVVFLSARGKPGTGRVEGSEQQSATPDASLDNANILFGGHAARLKQLDEEYARMLSDSVSGRRVEGAAKTIWEEEASFAGEVDSLSQQGRAYQTLVATFRSVLADRAILDNMRAALSSGTKGPDAGQQELLRAKNELLARDARIADLENRLKKMQQPVDPHATVSVQAMTKLQNDNNSLQSQLEEQAGSTAELKDLVNTLKHTNEKLTARLNDEGRSAGTAESAASSLTSKNAVLERKTDELASELRFAEIDCNLSRADARQVVYNSRQRKDLLADAYATLTELSKSEDLVIKRKAKERMTLLRNLAATVHD